MHNAIENIESVISYDEIIKCLNGPKNFQQFCQIGIQYT